MSGIQVLMKALSGLMYIINNEVSFNEEDGHLENSAAGVSVLMAMSTYRLLDVLISNQGNPVERDCLLKTVWDDNGLRSSNSNLNQYISILRKQLAQVGLPDNAVITLPRVGFMFNPDIDVHHEMPVTDISLAGESRAPRHFITGTLYWPVFTLSVLLLCVCVFYIYFHDREPGTVILNKLTGYPPGCQVYALPGRGGVNKMEPVSSVAQNCDDKQEYFVFKHTGSPDDWLIVSCEKNTPDYFSHCHNLRDSKE